MHNGSMTSTSVTPESIPLFHRTQILDVASTEDVPTGFTAWSEAAGGLSAEDLRDIAVQVAISAAGLVRSKREQSQDDAGHVAAYGLKSSVVDPVTEVDQASEELIRGELAKSVPGSRVLGEEGGTAGTDEESAASELLWVVDPIDGTVNFIYGLPAYSVSIAATIDGVPVAAAVADVAGEVVYSAASGGSSMEHSFSDANSGRTGKILSVHTEQSQLSLETTLVATGFSYLSERRRAQAQLLVELLPKVRDIRRIGSAALDLCHVAAGRVDAYYEHGLGPWDHAAGALIAARAGAIVRMPLLDVVSNDGLQVSAGNPQVFRAFEEAVVTGAAGGVLAPVATP